MKLESIPQNRFISEGVEAKDLLSLFPAPEARLQWAAG